MKPLYIFLTIFLLILLVACGNSIEATVQEEDLITVTPTFTQKPNITSTFLPSETSALLFTPTATLNPTQQIWVSTAIAVRETQQAVDEQTRENTGKEIDQFPKACEDSYHFDVSPDTKWLVTSCGNKYQSSLVVQNKEGIKVTTQ